MSDLRDPLLDDLDAMFRRREGDVGGAPRLTPGTRRTVRRRQGAVVGASALASAAVVALVVAIVARPTPPETPLDPPGAPATSTIAGVTITYPDDWHLVALPQATSDWADQEPRSAFRPVLQLSNFDPVSDEAGDGGRRWFCPLAQGRFPADGVLLYVEAIGGPIAEGAAGWPVPYPTDVTDIASGGACGGEGSVDATWTADGVTYHGIVMGDPSDPEVQGAFDSMRFSDGTPAVVGNVNEGPLTSEAYVLASGDGDLGPWNLFARAQDACLALANERSPVVWECQAWEMLGDSPYPAVTSFSPEGVGDHEVFGPVGAEVQTLENWLDDGRTLPVELVELPPSLGDRRAFVLTTPRSVNASLVGFTGDGLPLVPIAYAGRDPEVALAASGVEQGFGKWHWWAAAAPRGDVWQLSLWISPNDDVTDATTFTGTIVPADGSRPLVAIAERLGTTEVGPWVIMGVAPPGTVEIQIEYSPTAEMVPPLEDDTRVFAHETWCLGTCTVRALGPGGTVLAEGTFGD